MRLTVTVRAEGFFWDGGAAIEVPEPMIEAFKPLNTSDDMLTAWATGDTLVDSEKCQKVIEIRKDAAKYLSEALANYLINEMRKNDKHNGYNKY